MNVKQSLERRHSVRGFRRSPLPQKTLEELFETAQRAPSWCNTQPWRVAITAGQTTRDVSAAMIAACKAGPPSPEIPFPGDYPPPYDAHRRACGKGLYQAMGIERGDKAGRYDAWIRNYEIFDAPHLAVVSRDKRLGEYATLDVGVWLGVLLVTASSLGIDTCPMASIATYPAPLRQLLEIPDDHVILFGIALGHEDVTVSANACRTSRDPIHNNVRFVGF
jgi:nitroreductase